MSEASDAWVAWILIPLFVAVGLYLLWYARRRQRMMEAFAHRHGLRIHPGAGESIQRELDRLFPLDAPGLTRSFSRVRNVVDDGAVQLFRATELLDLNPHGDAQSSHHGRIAALFDAGGAGDAFFLLYGSGEIVPRIQGATSADDAITAPCREAAGECGARHTLSITFANGKGLAYFEPRVTGGETPSDLEALYCLARRLSARLAAPTHGTG